MKKVGIIGAGFTGLSAAYYLSKKGYEVTVFESEKKPGGLAVGFSRKNWDWTLEEHYHHWFTNDAEVLGLAKKIGQKVITIRPKTSTFVDGQILQLDSPASLLFFNKIPFFDRLRTGVVLFYLKVTPFWKPLEKITAEVFLKKYGGEVSWRVLWYPLFKNKFGDSFSKTPASWFWARIKKRTPALSYPKGGFQNFADRLVRKVRENGAEVLFKKRVSSVEKLKGGEFELEVNGKKYLFDQVICTLPTPLFTKITKGLPASYLESIKKLKGLGAVNLVLRLKKGLLKDGTYWLNINEVKFPFLAVVEHTNFMDKNHYGGEHLIYVGNYLKTSDKLFKMNEEQLLNMFYPYLKKINPEFSRSFVIDVHVFRANFAQPIIPLNYSKNILPVKTPINGLFLANIQQVYPWDRGTNYAVELGEKAAGLVVKSDDE